MIQFNDVFCVLLSYRWTSNFWLQPAADSIIRDTIKWRALYIEYAISTDTYVVLFENQFK